MGGSVYFRYFRREYPKKNISQQSQDHGRGIRDRPSLQKICPTDLAHALFARVSVVLLFVMRI